jgi:hypothetical protein
VEIAGTEAFYHRLGFLPMTTAVAIWDDLSTAIASGLLARNPDPDLRGSRSPGCALCRV